MGLLTQSDSTIYRGWFKELCHLRGLPILYRYVIEMDDTIHGEVHPDKLSDPIELNVIYEENPKIKTLRRIGWVSEDPNDKPYIMMFPFDTPHISVEARIEIPMIDAIPSRPRMFKITSITQLIEYPDCLVTTIVPVFDTENPKPDYRQSNNNYIDDRHKVRQ